MPFSKDIKRRKLKNSPIKTAMFLAALTVAITSSGCSFVPDSDPKSAFSGRDVTDARKVEIKKNIGIDDLRDIAESDDQQTVNISGIKTIDGQFLDVATSRLFDERLRDEGDRFDRIEYAVQTMHDDFSKMTPAINRLIAIESDIKELHDKLVTLIDNESSGASIKVTESYPEPKVTPLKNKIPFEDVASTEEEETLKDDVSEEFLPTVPTITKAVVEPPVVKDPIVEEKIKPEIKKTTEPTKPAEPKESAKIDARPLILRASESADKTRIVFETPAKENYEISYDADNKIITVITNQDFTAAQLDNIVKNSKQITGHSITRDADNNILAFTIQNVSDISKGYYLMPENKDMNYRFYFDIFK